MPGLYSVLWIASTFFWVSRVFFPLLMIRWGGFKCPFLFRPTKIVSLVFILYWNNLKKNLFFLNLNKRQLRVGNNRIFRDCLQYDTWHNCVPGGIFVTKEFSIDWLIFVKRSPFANSLTVCDVMWNHASVQLIYTVLRLDCTLNFDNWQLKRSYFLTYLFSHIGDFVRKIKIVLWFRFTNPENGDSMSL